MDSTTVPSTRRTWSRRKVWAGVGIGAAATVAFVSIGYAAIPSATGVISGCYNASSFPSGQLRVIDADAGVKCARNEKPISWNAQGVQGPQGTQGPQGQQGPQGPTGPAGATSVVVRYADVTNNSAVEATANCNTGERATGGGWDARGNGALLIPFVSRPNPSGAGDTPTGWYVDFGTAYTASQPNATGRVYVVCVSP